MAKKYKVHINYDEITEENFDDARKLRQFGLDGKICTWRGANDGVRIYFFKEHSSPLAIQKSWLTEIKEPLTRKESWGSYSARNKSVDEIYPEALYGSGWEACLKNQKLGHVVDEEKDHKALLKLFSELEVLKDDLQPNLATVSHIWAAALKYARGANDCLENQ